MEGITSAEKKGQTDPSECLWSTFFVARHLLKSLRWANNTGASKLVNPMNHQVSRLCVRALSSDNNHVTCDVQSFRCHRCFMKRFILFTVRHRRFIDLQFECFGAFRLVQKERKPQCFTRLHSPITRKSSKWSYTELKLYNWLQNSGSSTDCPASSRRKAWSFLCHSVDS